MRPSEILWALAHGPPKPAGGGGSSSVYAFQSILSKFQSAGTGFRVRRAAISELGNKFQRAENVVLLLALLRKSKFGEALFGGYC